MGTEGQGDVTLRQLCCSRRPGIRPSLFEGGGLYLAQPCDNDKQTQFEGTFEARGGLGQHIPIGQSSLPLQHLVSKRLERYPRLDGTALSESDAGSSKIAIASAEDRFNA